MAEAVIPVKITCQKKKCFISGRTRGVSGVSTDTPFEISANHLKFSGGCIEVIEDR